MANENAITKAVSQKTANAGKPATMQDYIKKMGGEIARALPSVMTPERFTRITLSALSSNRKLQECTPQSFLAAMMTAAQLGLEPNTPLGQAYLIPYKNHGVQECQFQLGYKGLVDLAYRSGEVTIVQAHAVYENDEFEYTLGIDPVLRHVPARKDRGAPILFYGMFRTKSGGYGFEVMSVEDVRHHANRFSKSVGKGPWVDHFEEMAKKTVLKKALKYAPMRSDFVRAIAQDESIKREVAEDMADVQTVYLADEDYSVDEDTGEVLQEAQEDTGDASSI